MFRVTAILALFLVAACASAPAPAPEAPITTVATPPRPSRIAALLSQAGERTAPNLQAVQRELGEADIVRLDGAGAALTYRLDNCALMLLFAADGANEMRLAEAHPSARRGGEVTPSLDQCAAEVEARQAP